MQRNLGLRGKLRQSNRPHVWALPARPEIWYNELIIRGVMPAGEGGTRVPSVSVIVPVYGVEAYLEACLSSIAAQTCGDFEVIMVNDGTRDGSPAIMARWAKADPRFRVLCKENGGLSSARNAGMDEAAGDYLLFVDADDWIAPNLVEDTLRAARESGAEQVHFNYRRAFEERVEDAYLPLKDEVVDLRSLGLPTYFYRYWMPYVHGQEAWARLYRRSVVEENHLRFAPNDEVFAEDTLMSAMLLFHTERLAVLKEPYLYYRQRPGSIMDRPKPRLAQRLIALSSRLNAYARACGLERTLKDVLPVLCYDKLITKGISQDPSLTDVHGAMREALYDPEIVQLLRALRGVEPLLQYTLHTGKGLRTQVRARLFAARWLRGDVEGAAALVARREEKA